MIGRGRLSSEERAKREQHRARVRYSLTHPFPLVVDPRLAYALTIIDAHFEAVTYVYSDKPICDWSAIPDTRPDDARYDEQRSELGQSCALTRLSALRAPSREPRNWNNAARYIAALLLGAYDDVADAKVGNRNNALTRAAFQYGRVVGAGYLDGVRAQVALEEAAMKCGLPSREARFTIRSGLRAGSQHPLER